jgi:radical SAM-linked protein
LENLRVIFSKSKDAIFLTHLDVMKIFEESFIRADIKIKYTEKKNSKPLITFADPLPKGVESVGEVMEVSLLEKVDVPYFVREINKVLPAGITVLNAEYSIDDGISIMDKVYASMYLISLIYDNNKFINKTPRQIEEMKKDYQKKLKEYLERDYLLVLKKSNTRMERIDIKHDIINFDFLIDGSLEITICSGLRKKLEPSNIMVGFNEYISENIAYNLKRTKILYK